MPTSAGPDGAYYLPINIAQFDFVLHAGWLETGTASPMVTLESCLAVLEDLKTEADKHCVCWHDFHNKRYDTEPPWASAMHRVS